MLVLEVVLAVEEERKNESLCAVMCVIEKMFGE